MRRPVMGPRILPSELLEVIRLSLKATEALAAVPFDPNAPSRPSSPERQRLIEHILFSRHFVLTYYGVIGAFVVPFILVHWHRKYQRREQSKKSSLKDGTDTPLSQASSSSGLSRLRRKESEDAMKLQTEATPLLSSKPGRGFGLSAPFVLHRHVKAFLMTQPKPIPALTAPINLLPPYGTQLAILILLAINAFYLFHYSPLEVIMLFAFADRAGLCFVINLPILYILAAKTNQPLQYLTGWSYEGLNLFHRRLGEWMIILATLHGVGMMAAWYTLLRPLNFTLIMFLSSKVILLGIAAFFAYLAIYLTSVGWFRRLYYERFLALHIILQVAALLFLFFHYHLTRPYVIASVAIWALDRIATRICVSNQKLIATLEVAPDKKTVFLFCDISLRKADSSFKTNITHGWAAGQHVFVTVPSIGWMHKLQAHPFTIASPAPPSTLRNGVWPLQLTIRAQDGFSKELLEFAEFHQHTVVYLDGPYGGLDVLEASRAADRVCLVAGGSGIAVTYPLAYDLRVQDREDALINTRMTYESGRRRLVSISTVEAQRASRYGHLWVRQDEQSNDWIKYVAKESYARDRKPNVSPPNGETLVGEAVLNLVTTSYETAGAHRPDIKTELREWIGGGSTSEGVVFVVSGPDGLVRDVRNSAADLVRAGYDIDVHVEKFGW